jgi:hypothetical protein
MHRMTTILNRLRDHSKELELKIDRKLAWDVLSRNFAVGMPRKIASGIAVSSGRKNANGNAFVAAGLTITLPTPVLANHDWLKPIGRIIHLESYGDQVHFTAEIANTGALAWAETAWDAILDKSAACVSIGPRNLTSYEPADATLYHWCIDEISVCRSGADPDARILRVWETSGAVYLDGRPTERVFWNSSQR